MALKKRDEDLLFKNEPVVEVQQEVLVEVVEEQAEEFD